jgi:Holliday junction DNA helicase RuvA
MITRITGVLNRALDEEVRLQMGGLEYQVLVPEYIRRTVQGSVGKEFSFHTMHFFEGDPSRGKVIPRLVGFLHESELEFFELFCTVDGVGTRKALKALVRPVKEVADAIQRQDSKWLTTLPGIGAATAEKVIATLKRKVTRYALATASRAQVNGTESPGPEPVGGLGGEVLEQTYVALMALGQSPIEARLSLDHALRSGKTFESVQDVITYIFQR